VDEKIGEPVTEDRCADGESGSRASLAVDVRRIGGLASNDQTGAAARLCVYGMW
jgi:hypothetical protein